MAVAFLTNVLFWSGVAIGGIVFAALLEVTGGEWAGPLRLTAEAFRWFLPISFLSVLILLWRRDAVYPWASQSLASPWFASRFVALRIAVTFAVVYATAFAFCHASDRARADPATRSSTMMAIVFLVVYAIGFSLIAVDAIMSVEPRWTSTLFPAYVFTANVYAGIAALATLASWNLGNLAGFMSAGRSRDMANVLVAAALFWLYLFWSQFLVLWYGNVTAEVGYMMARLNPLRGLAWTVLAICCAVPSIVLVPRAGKRLAVIRIVATLVLIGMWLERWILVAPDMPARSPAAAVLITASFAAAFVLSVRPSIGKDHAFGRDEMK